MRYLTDIVENFHVVVPVVCGLAIIVAGSAVVIASTLRAGGLL